MGRKETLLLGTTKGAFLLRRRDGKRWAVDGPHCDGAPINHVVGDPETGQLWAAGGNDWTGIGVWRSDDSGATWNRSELGFEIDADHPVETIWSLGRVGERVFAGTKPAALFVSDDDGQTWRHLAGLRNHPTTPDWFPGGAGLILHSIVADPARPEKIWVGISAVGVFGSEDGGTTWEPRNRGTRNDYAPKEERFPEVGLCVHNVVRAPGQGDRLYQQNHFGTYRSDDGGRHWTSIEKDLPSSFGFPIAVHPQDPDTAWCFPLNGDSLGRYPPDASAAVWRTRDAGETWQALRNGLPNKDCFFTVLRQAMAVDHAAPGSLYFGTNSGSVFASEDAGDQWQEIASHLPTVLSVESLSLAD